MLKRGWEVGSSQVGGERTGGGFASPFGFDRSLESHYKIDGSEGVRSLEDVLSEGKKSLQEKNNPNTKNGVTYALFGSSGCGKSTLLKKVFIEKLYCNDDVQKTADEYISVFFTGSKHSDALDGVEKRDHEGCGRGTIVDSAGVDQDIYQWMYQMNYKYKKKYNFVVMIDDVLDVKQMPVILPAFLTYRNMNISSAVSLQYLKMCPLSVRSSLYFVFLMPCNSREGIEGIVRAYMAMYLRGKTINDKISAYEELTRGYKCFLIDNLNHKAYYVDNNYNCVRLLPCLSEADNETVSKEPNPGGEKGVPLFGFEKEE